MVVRVNRYCMKPLASLFDLTGRVALVTGGSRGLGEEIAEGLGEAGAALMVVARREQWLLPTVESLRSKGFQVESAVCDVSQPDQVEAAVARCVAAFGKIDILVNNAGVAWGQPAEELPLDKWRMVLDTNLTGAFLFAQAAGRRMIEQRFGRVINIASINGIYGGLVLPETHISSYAASKAGLIGLTRELAVHWAQHGIRVNAIAPGYFQTRMTEKLWDLADARMKTTPMGRAGAEDELKGVAVFLASAASDYITGQCLVVDGGATLV